MARILIQNTGTGWFYKEPSEWVATRDEATDFATSANAREFSATHKLRDVQLLMDFGDPQFDVALSINLEMQ